MMRSFTLPPLSRLLFAGSTSNDFSLGGLGNGLSSTNRRGGSLLRGIREGLGGGTLLRLTVFFGGTGLAMDFGAGV